MKFRRKKRFYDDVAGKSGWYDKLYVGRKIILCGIASWKRGGIIWNMADEAKTPAQSVLEDLQRFRKRSDVEMDYKAELAKAREEK